jgi:ABC-2 type transport system permease protein
MRLLSVFRKTMVEQGRDPLVLLLTLIFAPLFVFLYWLWFPSGSTTYGVLIINQDAGFTRADNSRVLASNEFIESLNLVTYKNDAPLLEVQLVTDREAAEKNLRDRDAELLVIIPAGFSSMVYGEQTDPAQSADPLVISGDLTNPYYAITAILADAALDEYLQVSSGQESRIPIVEEALGSSAARTEFEIYVPGLLIFAVIMLIFQASMLVAREIESGALKRLRLTRLTSLEYLGGITLSLMLTGVLSVALTFGIAILLGFHSQGSVLLAVLIGAVTSLSIIGVGLIIASFVKNVTQAFLLANFPMGLFMFFSGAIFPLPRTTLFSLFGHAFSLNEILPTTHGVVALNKVLTLGAGAGDVAFELASLVVLSAVYFAVGVYLFQKNAMESRR